MALSAAFARVLASGRRQFNARVEETKRRTPGFDAANFVAFLRDGVDGVVEAVDAVAPARTVAVAFAAYEVALGLCAHGLAGPAARGAALNAAWSRLLPRLAAQVAEQPQLVLGALSNAVVHLAGVDGVRRDDWLAAMAAAGARAETVAQLLDLGQVLAWRAGMAHWRRGALAVAARLPPALLQAASGGPAPVSSATSDDPWADPWDAARVRPLEGWQLGAFSGFGGRFTQPPELRIAPEGFVVRSGARHFLAIADAFGAVLLPASAEEFAAAAAPQASGGPRWRDGRLVFAGHELAFDLPAEGLVLAADAHTVAIASPYAHAIRLLPLR